MRRRSTRSSQALEVRKQKRAAGRQPGQALEVEIQVEVAAGVERARGVVSRGVVTEEGRKAAVDGATQRRLVGGRADSLLAHIGRVADHDVERRLRGERRVQQAVGGAKLQSAGGGSAAPGEAAATWSHRHNAASCTAWG